MLSAEIVKVLLQRPLLFISLCVRGSSYLYAACEIDRDSQEVKR